MDAFFKDLTASGQYDNSNVIHVECLSFCFTSLIQEELHRVAQRWNLHRIRPSNGEMPAGRPDVLFFLPEESNTTHYKIATDESDLDVAENLCGPREHPLGCSSLFESLAELIMEENKLQLPRNTDEALSLYLELKKSKSLFTSQVAHQSRNLSRFLWHEVTSSIFLLPPG